MDICRKKNVKFIVLPSKNCVLGFGVVRSSYIWFSLVRYKMTGLWRKSSDPAKPLEETRQGISVPVTVRFDNGIYLRNWAS